MNELMIQPNSYCDQTIWSDFLNGDKIALEKLYRSHFKILLQCGLRVSSNRCLVKDCIHDLFVEIWIKRENLTFPSSIKAYLIVSLRRKLVRHLKRLKGLEKDFTDVFNEKIMNSIEDDFIEEQFLNDRKKNIERAMLLLSKRQRDAIYFRFYENQSYEDIASIMSIGVGSVYNLISKSVKVLHEELQKQKSPL